MLLASCERSLRSVGIERTGSERVVVACSGGADSVALLRVTVLLLGPGRVVAAHVDHRVRGDSRDDADFVEQLCIQKGIRCCIERLNPPRSDEATLRALRYDALERIRVRVDAAIVLVAHTQDDQAETVLFRLLRNGSVRSLRGMSERRGRIVRPWLDIPRSHVRSYLHTKRWGFREDPSNREPAFLRNRLRKELLPLIERRYAPGAARRLARLAAEVEQVDRCGLSPEPAPARPSETRSVGVGFGRPSAGPDFGPHDPRFSWMDAGVAFERGPWRPGTVPERSPYIAVFDAAELHAPRLRPFRPGDRVRVFGQKEGRRRVSDVLSEAGVPVALRGRWPLVVDADDTVLWVAGVVRSDRSPVRPETNEAWMFSVRGPN